MFQRPARLFDRLFNEANLDRMDGWVVHAAILGFVLHLFVIFANQWIFHDHLVSELAGHNPLFAIYTPFSFVLLFEVLLMVAAIPESFSRAIGVQFQIMALIVARSAFKELGGIEDLGQFEANLPIYRSMLMDLGTGLALFLLIGTYFRLIRVKPPGKANVFAMTGRLERFIQLKKSIALVLALALVAIAVSSLLGWLGFVTASSSLGQIVDRPDVNGIFYREFFSLLIFADIFIVLYSLKEDTRFVLVFRNVGFVLSTIIMRLYFVCPRPYNLAVALSGVLFGTLTLAIAVAYAYLDSPKSE